MKTTNHNLSRILLVDDDPDNLLFIRMALRGGEMPNPIDCVGSGEEALEYLGRRGPYARFPDSAQPSVILLDLNIPGKDGFATLQEIRRNRALDPIAVLLLGASSNPEDIYKAYEFGADAYLIKPAAFTRMVEMVKSLKNFLVRQIFEKNTSDPIKEAV